MPTSQKTNFEEKKEARISVTNFEQKKCLIENTKICKNDTSNLHLKGSHKKSSKICWQHWLLKTSEKVAGNP